MDAKLCVEEYRTKRLKSIVSEGIHWIDLLSNTLEVGRTSIFIHILGVTVRWISIDGSDETVHRELFQSNRGRLIFAEALSYKTHPITPVESRSDGQDIPPHVSSRPL